jgi:hypothetical protein
MMKTVAFSTQTGERLREVPVSDYKGAEYDFADLIEKHGHHGIEIWEVEDGETLQGIRDENGLRPEDYGGPIPHPLPSVNRRDM